MAVEHLQAPEEDLFETFKQTEIYRNIHEEAIWHTVFDLNHHYIRANFLKAVLGHLTLQLLKEAPGQAGIKSREETLAAYQKLYPDAELIKHPFGLDSLQGVRVFDGARFDATTAYFYAYVYDSHMLGRAYNAFRKQRSDLLEPISKPPQAN